MFMLRAIWSETSIAYRLVDIPLELLRLIRNAEIEQVGRREGRRSLGGDIFIDGEVVFHVHFDGSDGKCQVRNLLVSRCQLLGQWVQRL